MASSVTALAKLAIGASDPVDQPLNFVEFQPNVRLELRDTNATRGTYDKDGNRVRHSRTVITPRGVFEPSATELTYLLPWAMGGSPTGSGVVTYPAANAPAERYVFFSPVAGDTWFLSGVGVDVATFRAASGEPLTVELDLLGTTYNTAHAAYPSLTIDQTTQPFMLSDLVLTVGGSAVQCRAFSYRLNNNLDKTRYLNSLTLTRLQKLARQHTFTLDVPSGDNASLWDNGVAGTTLVATFTNPNTASELILTVPDLRFPGQSPEHAPNAEGFLRVEGEAYRTSGNANPVTVTLDVSA